MIVGQGAGVHAGKADDAALFKKGVKAALRTEVGGSLAPVLYNIGGRTNGIAFKVGGNNAVIANKGEGLHYHLPPIAAVGQSFQIAGHSRGEHHFSGHLAFGAETLAPKDLAVFQHQISRFPHTLNPFSVFFDAAAPGLSLSPWEPEARRFCFVSLVINSISYPMGGKQARRNFISPIYTNSTGHGRSFLGPAAGTLPGAFRVCPHDEKSAHPLAGTVAFQGMDAFVLLL